ncbi:MAG: 2-oxoglutarate dehydrogenase E1 component [Paracoccaceae bacterium]
MIETNTNITEIVNSLDTNSLQILEQMYDTYIHNPQILNEKWITIFKVLSNQIPYYQEEEIKIKPSWFRQDWPPKNITEEIAAFDGQWGECNNLNEKIGVKSKVINTGASGIKTSVLDSIRALMFIRAYRVRGHLAANLDPLSSHETKKLDPALDPKTYGFNKEDMTRQIYLDNVLGLEEASMYQISKIVKKTYCGTFALQYMHISNAEESAWLKERIEGLGKEIEFTQKGRKAILNKLIEAEGFEKFLHVKYMGTKRFGLDGGEAVIPAMEQIIKRGGNLGVKEIIIGMPHRGRLSILANVMGKPYRAIFNEFQGGSYKPEEVEGSGDVKYHLGASSDREFDGNKIHLSLTANPSHLEAVNPVVLGKVRAKQNQLYDNNRVQVLPVLLHGDAAFAGQGIISECFGLSGLKGHKTGGTIHIIVNNQIGFTTAPHNSRSSPYPTDIALMVEAPIFHVNGDDPEAVVHAAKVATEFRQKFHKDVVIDIFCYRRFGHNEGDEPMFTQPKMYAKIKKHKTTLQQYSEKLSREGLIPEGEIEDLKMNFQNFLSEEFESSKSYKPNKADWLDGKWSGLGKYTKEAVVKDGQYQRGKTSISLQTFNQVGKALTKIPDQIDAHKTVKRMLDNKQKQLTSGENIDWATAEALAFGSLLVEGFPVRLSGQDCTRGTFSHRHSAVIDQLTEERYYPLNNISKNQKHYEVIDSMLSEYAVLGYEYGYSLAEPNSLTIWEAQFGDFSNGAQIMIDQFISSGEKKWLRMSGLVMLLPHGYEGQGPEHSSARLERFLQSCAEDNWIIANCTTPANYFHILRRQLYRSFRKPLVIMSPKSLLRNKRAISSKENFVNGSTFHRVLWDDAEKGNSITKLQKDSKIKRVVICSGKIYFDLLNEREQRKISDIYLLRLEQFYPFPALSFNKELRRFKDAEFIWCQEEPKNQGGWSFVEPNLEWSLNRVNAKYKRAKYIGRASASSPATGLAKQHKKQQELIINEALTIN